MTLVKTSQNTFPSVWNHFFDSEILNPTSFFNQASKNALVNIKDTENQYEIEIEAPGFNKEDFNIAINDNVMNISAEKEETSERQGERFVRKEFRLNNVNRSFNLPDTADFDKISAKYESGILMISIAKKEEVIINNNRKIEIQ